MHRGFVLVHTAACMLVHVQGMNEMGDTGCSDIANALIAATGNQLHRLQLRLNRIRNDGGVRHQRVFHVVSAPEEHDVGSVPHHAFW